MNTLRDFMMNSTFLLELLFGRILFANMVLAILICLIMFVRKNLAPTIRSWLWGLCIPALFIPFEHGIVTIMRSLYAPHDLVQGKLFYALETCYKLLPYLWIVGLIVFMVKTHGSRNSIMRLLRTGELSGCAAYFYKGRSHIYLPHDFETVYTSTEREMLLAHENQHITQHDPLLYRFLQAVQCILWFNPLIHMAVRCIRQDRELLCDERVVCNRPKHEYGMLLLREAQKNPIVHMIPGIVSETGGVYERVAACVKPLSENRKPAAIVTGIAAVMFIIGLMGFVKPIVSSPMDAQIYIEQSGDFLLLENTEKFVMLTPDSVTLDQQGLFEHAISIGLEHEQKLGVSLNQYERMTLTGAYGAAICIVFTVSQLETEDLSFPYGNTGWGIIYRLL